MKLKMSKCTISLYTKEMPGNNRLGKKLYITGKGRCNVTNAESGEGADRTLVIRTGSAFYYLTGGQCTL